MQHHPGGMVEMSAICPFFGKLFGTGAHRLAFAVALITSAGGLQAGEAGGDYPFGPIFTGQKERIQLDRFRIESARNGELVQLPSSLVSDAAGQDGQTERVQFSGYISRPNGTQVIWVDGVTNIGTAAKDIRVSQGVLSVEQGLVEFETARGSAALKPGQVWLLDESRVVENYEVSTGSLKEVLVSGGNVSTETSSGNADSQTKNK